VTVAGFFGPLAGNIYLPALPVLQRVFGVGETAMNATVSSFMFVFAFAVRLLHHSGDEDSKLIPLSLSSGPASLTTRVAVLCTSSLWQFTYSRTFSLQYYPLTMELSYSCVSYKPLARRRLFQWGLELWRT
jgi:MFS family permease